jgi:serine/threonine protein kinase
MGHPYISEFSIFSEKLGFMANFVFVLFWNISVELQDVFESDAFIFLVFELCRHGELFDYLTSVVTLSEKKTRYIMRYGLTVEGLEGVDFQFMAGLKLCWGNPTICKVFFITVRSSVITVHYSNEENLTNYVVSLAKLQTPPKLKLALSKALR